MAEDGCLYRMPQDMSSYRQDLRPPKAWPPLVIRPISTKDLVSPLVSKASAVDGCASEHGEEVAHTHRTRKVGACADVFDEDLNVLHSLAQTAFEDFSANQSRRPRAGQSCHPGCRRCICRRRSHGLAGRRRVLSLTSRLLGFAVLLFLVTYYAHKCVNKRFSELSSRRTSLHHNRKKRADKLPFSSGRGRFRRLAEKKVPYVSVRNGKRDAEEALCSAIEGSGRARLATAPQTAGDESEKETEPVLSTHPTGMEEG